MLRNFDFYCLDYLKELQLFNFSFKKVTNFHLIYSLKIYQTSGHLDRSVRIDYRLG